MSITSIGSYPAAAIYAARNPQSSGLASNPPESAAARMGDAAAEEFLKFAKMSPAEKIRYAYLQEHGLSEDDLKGMSAADREAIEAEIRQQIRQSVERSTEKKTGQITNIHV
jgi:hypothetical protein